MSNSLYFDGKLSVLYILNKYPNSSRNNMIKAANIGGNTKENTEANMSRMQGCGHKRMVRIEAHGLTNVAYCSLTHPPRNGKSEAIPSAFPAVLVEDLLGALI